MGDSSGWASRVGFGRRKKGFQKKLLLDPLTDSRKLVLSAIPHYELARRGECPKEAIPEGKSGSAVCGRQGKALAARGLALCSLFDNLVKARVAS